MKFHKRMEITKRGYRLLHTYTPGLIRAKTVSAVIEGLFPFVSIWFSAQIINELMGERRQGVFLGYILAITGIHFLFSMIKNVSDKVGDEKEADMWNQFRKIFTDKQLSMDYADLENQEIQKQKQKAEENLFMFGNGLGQLVWNSSDLARVVTGIIASVSLTVSLFKAKSGNKVMDSWLWIPAILAVMILLGYVYYLLEKKENHVFAKWTEGTVWFNRTFQFFGHELYDNTRRAKDVRIYGQEKMAEREFEKMEAHNEEDNAYLNKMSSYKGFTYLAKGTGSALCYLFVVTKAALGAFGTGSIVQYVGAFTELANHVGFLMLSYLENRIYTEHLEKLFEYLDLPNNKYQGKLPVEKNFFCNDGENDYEIEFRNVSFKYPGSDTYVLNHINTRLSIGKKQAFVGTNGAGKTTFVKLLCRLYDPTEGEILLNGIDIKKYDYEEYMSLFAFVFQDFKLFSFTLGQNIAANKNYDRNRVEECIKKVSFYDRYLAMEEGLDTYLYQDISEKGLEISGGEAQKIALARALYKGTPMIVLDEPTAALDPFAEARVYEDFSLMVEHKTAIYISHRLSSCRFCDEITVFDSGRIVQKGTHAELVKDKTGQYFALWNAQARYYQKA
ncbi:MAG TPA: ABC transporter ATP-binding protein [Lachnospiraceae bacterium]|nr:ABC transporter ATP-binding protein [Lachnospiraceae bacterium]